MTKDQIVKLESTLGLKIEDVLGDMCVTRSNSPIDHYKYNITDIAGNRVKIKEYVGWHDIYLFFKLEEGTNSKRGHALTKMFNLEKV